MQRYEIPINLQNNLNLFKDFIQYVKFVLNYKFSFVISNIFRIFAARKQ